MCIRDRLCSTLLLSFSVDYVRQLPFSGVLDGVHHRWIVLSSRRMTLCAGEACGARPSSPYWTVSALTCRWRRPVIIERIDLSFSHWLLLLIACHCSLLLLIALLFIWLSLLSQGSLIWGFILPGCHHHHHPFVSPLGAVSYTHLTLPTKRIV